MDYQSAIAGKNVAESLSEDKLNEIGNSVVDGFLNDKATRKEWELEYIKWMELALQVVKAKTYPWNNASNVKFPLLSTAAMQFNARAYPTLIPSDGKVVQCKVTGADPDGEKFKRAQRISKHMSYQLLEEMPEWEDDMDKLLLVLPIIGMCFKKTYWNPESEVNTSCLILPDDLVVNYHTKSLKSAERTTEILYKSKRKLKECQLSEYYLDVKLGDPTGDSAHEDANTFKLEEGTIDETTPYTLLEQHTFLDLDDDGYPEPWIVTVDYDSRKVLRIAARFEADGVTTNATGKIIRIEPIQYYTKYGFIPNPDGSFYDIGFGKLLGPLNASIDTIINQLIDSGSLNNLQAGFIGKGLRIRMGEHRFQPGEWKAVNATGDDIKKQIFPLPTKDPSPVLFQLLGSIITSVKELASVSEIMVGKMPGQNTPAYTTQQTVEQGSKLFTSIYKRIYRSLKEEFRKLYRLNKTYLDVQEEVSVLDEPISQSDYQVGSADDIVPAADPSAASQTEKMAKAQQLAQMLALGTLDPMKVTMRLLEAMEEENPQNLLPQGPPPPDPKVQIEQAKMQAKQQDTQMKAQVEQLKVQLEAAKMEKELAMKQQDQIFQHQIESAKAEADLRFKTLEAQIKLQTEAQKSHQGLQQSAQQHELKMATQEDTHQQQMKQNKEQAKEKPKTTKE